MKKLLLALLIMFIGITNVNALHDYVDYLTGNVLNSGYNRTQVRYLQKELNMVIGCDLDTDGIPGNLTRNCVRDFQRKYGLTVDGLVGKQTRNKLNQLYLENKVIVSANNLNIRNNPGTSGTTIIGRVTKGNILTVLGTTYVGSKLWYHIRYNEITGYVISDYVRSTFVEVDIVSQTLRLYVNMELLLDTPVTTGKADGEHDTNKGFFYALFKDTDRYLQPSNSYVRYWVRFYDTRALGIHDADWRGNTVNYNYFGGTRYQQQNYNAGSKYSGSHGCVNVPVPKMPIIYNSAIASWTNTNIATPVYVH